jgi:hypothetical protein
LAHAGVAVKVRVRFRAHAHQGATYAGDARSTEPLVVELAEPPGVVDTPASFDAAHSHIWSSFSMAAATYADRWNMGTWANRARWR